MKKILFTSNTANFSKFNRPFMRWFRTKGWGVDYAAPGDETIRECDNHFIVNMSRSPLSLKNIPAFFRLRKIVQNGCYDIVHCHTPVAALLTRFVCRNERKRGLKVIYTAHGFHFYKGAPLINWALYYPVEKFLSRWTDCIVTINDEDFTHCKRHKYRTPAVYKLDGVGVDLSRFYPADRATKEQLRKEYGFGSEEFILIYAAELNKNKNHILLIERLPWLKEKIPNLRVLFAGRTDGMTDQARRMKELQVNEFVNMLGYRNDVDRLFRLSDICVSTSKREGLPVNVIEGLACGLPAVCTRIRGHKDIITEGVDGFLFDVDDPATMANSITLLANDPEKRNRMGEAGNKKSAAYSIDIALAKMASIYSQYM